MSTDLNPTDAPAASAPIASPPPAAAPATPVAQGTPPPATAPAPAKFMKPRFGKKGGAKPAAVSTK